ncbi:helix-turn-helix transcriptional regulator [Lysobacter enzymogenes]|uniref:AlpA family transcriptional regulator n=1 Tax=Lysobacter enzymogenes TaxID=69 RepID=A0A3N2RQ78_LYSEN|nr:AlpA family transcriptional regulator [Lysobacter enzymogenes]ROU09491.1 AlpA family transcriptional regulator [Lysobacter enzymogenes]
MTGEPHPRRLLRIQEVCDRVGLSKTTIYARMTNNDFPKPVPLGGVVAWVESEIDQWIGERIAERGV